MPGAKARIRLDGADPINNGLAGFWPLMDGAGSRARNAVSAQSAALISSPAWTARGLTWASGSYVEAPANTAYDFVRGGTVSFWVRGLYASQITYGNLFSKASGGVTEWSLFREAATTALSLYSLAAAGQVTFAGALFQEIMDGRLNHVCYTQNGTTATIYINGRSRDSKTITAPTYQSLPLRFGNDAGATGYINGQMQSVRFFNRALLPAEVARLGRDPWAGTARGRAPVPFIYPPLSATITGTIPITAEITATLQPFVVDGADTHDGIKRSRRLRRIEALRQRADDERLADAQALRLSLEAALGLAAEMPTDDAPRVAEAVQRAPKPAEVDWRRVADDAEQYARLSTVVARLSTLVQAEAKRRADADDDDDAAFLLGIA